MACKACNDTGWVVYKKIIDKVDHDYGARCTCKFGARLSERIPTLAQVGLDYHTAIIKRVTA